jgi:hypothetical protein
MVGGSATVYADRVPPDIYAYPRVYYEGDYAYLVGERWYYPSRHGWVVLRHEPPELYRYRVSYPPAYPREYRPYEPYEPRHYAPPAPYSYPPPAARVR